MKSAVAYLRVSTDGQADGYGLDTQRDAIQEYADRCGYEITEWYEEVGSGAKERPVLESIIADPKADAIIVFKNDRVARDTKLYFYYVFLLEKQGVKLLSTMEEFEDQFANIYRSILMFVAEQERKNITIRTSGGRKQKANGGGYSGGRSPYGYRIVDGEYEVNESEAEVVKMIYRFRDMGLSLRAICSKLDELGIVKRNGTPFRASGINDILHHRRTYEGEYHYSDCGWTQGRQQRIL